MVELYNFVIEILGGGNGRKEWRRVNGGVSKKETKGKWRDLGEIDLVLLGIWGNGTPL